MGLGLGFGLAVRVGVRVGVGAYGACSPIGLSCLPVGHESAIARPSFGRGLAGRRGGEPEPEGDVRLIDDDGVPAGCRTHKHVISSRGGSKGGDGDDEGRRRGGAKAGGEVGRRQEARRGVGAYSLVL